MLLCVYVCVVCTCLCGVSMYSCKDVCMYLCEYRAQKSTLDIFLNHILPCFLRQGLFLSLDLTSLVSQLTSLVSLLGQWDTEIYLLLPARELPICNIVSYLTFTWC